MAQYVLIENGVVTNVVEWDGDAQSWSPPPGAQAEPYNGPVSPGWLWDNGSAVDPNPAAPPPPPVISASPAQFRKELRAMNKLDAVKALIALQDEETQDDFEYATEFRSNSPKLLALAAHPSIGMSEQDVYDALKRAAARNIGA